MPDIIEVQRNGEEELILIGCDGIWEKYGDDHEQLTRHFITELRTYNSSDCLKQFFDKNLNPGTTPTDPYGRDNMTAILLEFKKWSLLPYYIRPTKPHLFTPPPKECFTLLLDI